MDVTLLTSQVLMSPLNSSLKAKVLCETEACTHVKSCRTPTETSSGAHGVFAQKSTYFEGNDFPDVPACQRLIEVGVFKQKLWQRRVQTEAIGIRADAATQHVRKRTLMSRTFSTFHESNGWLNGTSFVADSPWNMACHQNKQWRRTMNNM